MRSQSFNKNTLRRSLRKFDFKLNSDLLDPDKRDLFLESAAKQAVKQPPPPLIKVAKQNLHKFEVFTLVDQAQTLVERRLRSIINHTFNVKQDNRNRIIKTLVTLLREGTPYRVYRLDIKQFYESINRHKLFDLIASNDTLTPTTLFVLNQYMYAVSGSTSGIHRGLSSSPLLAEIYLEKFDKQVIRLPNVYFYARYVDDIIVMTTGEEDKRQFKQALTSALPQELSFNKTGNKYKILDIPKNEPIHTGMISWGSFDYLGYRFTINSCRSNSQIQKKRDIKIGLAAKKAQKIKTRIIHSIRDFDKNGDFNLLYDRLRYLTSNHSVYDKKLGKMRNAGIYYSYPFLTNAQNSALDDLDNFLINTLKSKNYKWGHIIATKLTKHQIKKLTKNSFKNGHKNKVFCYFPSSRLNVIQKCWKYV